MALHRIRHPNIKKLALVEQPASGHRWHLFKTAPQPGTIIRPSGDWKIAYTVVAAPGHVEGGGITKTGSAAVGEDGQPAQDVWEPDDIRQAAHSFARNGGLTVDQHFEDGQTLGRWAESYIAPVDHEIEGHPIKAGSWVLGLEPTEEGRAAIEQGRIGGVSVEGDAVREPVSKEERAMERIRLARAAMPWTMGKQSAADDGCDCVDQLIEDVTVSLVKTALVKTALSTKGRKQIPKSKFAIPEKAPGPGSYPVDTRGRAANALSRGTQNATPAERARIKRKVCRLYPSLPSCKLNAVYFK